MMDNDCPQQIVSLRPLTCAQPMRGVRMRMVVLLVMLAQKILPIIVAVGRAHDGMDVLT